MIMTFLITKNWNQQGLKVFDELLEFWRTWPNLHANQKLIVCISVMYETKPTVHSKKSWLTWLLSLLEHLRGFSKRHQIRRLNDSIRNQLENLHKSSPTRSDRLLLTILPELMGIDRQPVEEWARSQDIRDFLGEAAVGKLMPKIRKIFEAQTQETMPMEELADRLNELLHSLATKKE